MVVRKEELGKRDQRRLQVQTVLKLDADVGTILITSEVKRCTRNQDNQPGQDEKPRTEVVPFLNVQGTDLID